MFGGGFSSALTWTLSVTPMSICHPEHLEGGKIICPPQVLNAITKSEVVYPILFKISSPTKTLYCGPVDWTAETGRVYVPDWMMANLGVENNSKIRLSVTELPTGSFVKFKPQSTNFLTKISDPRAVLEHKLRNYAALKVGEVIYFQYVKNDYFLEVLECKPASHGAISIIEANLEVDFAPPDGYVEPTVAKKSSSSSSHAAFAMDEDDVDGEVEDLGLGSDSEDDEGGGGRSGSRPKFVGTGQRPSGKAVLDTPNLPELASSPSGRKFITSSGSLVVGPPPKDSFTPTPSSSAGTSNAKSPAPTSSTPSPAFIGTGAGGQTLSGKPVSTPLGSRGATPLSAATSSASSSTPTSKPATPKPTANNPVPADESKPSESKFVAFSGSGFKLQ